MFCLHPSGCRWPLQRICLPCTCLRVMASSGKCQLCVQRGFASKELEWVHEEDVPDREAQSGAACPFTAAVTAAAGMSEQALARWMDAFPAEGHPEPPAASYQDQDKATVSSPCRRSRDHL